MKKLINIVCSVILLICLGISFTSLQMSLEIKAKAETIDNDKVVLEGGSGSNIGGLKELSMDEIPNDDGIMEYFKYMTNNLPNNPKNFCVYVSFAMMLSYYNEYWDDKVFDVEKLKNSHEWNDIDYDENGEVESFVIYVDDINEAYAFYEKVTKVEDCPAQGVVMLFDKNV